MSPSCSSISSSTLARRVNGLLRHAPPASQSPLSSFCSSRGLSQASRVQNVLIVGGGFMGSGWLQFSVVATIVSHSLLLFHSLGIAQVAAIPNRFESITLYDKNPGQIDNARKNIVANLTRLKEKNKGAGFIHVRIHMFTLNCLLQLKTSTTPKKRLPASS